MVEVVPLRPKSGEHERHLAISAIAQQISQVAATLSMLAAITVLARRLSLSEFGTYGLLVSFTSYVLFAQSSIETAAVKGIAEAVDQSARDRAYSTALALYAAVGVVAGGAIAAVGSALLGPFGIPIALYHQAQLGVFALALVTGAGWPLKVFQDMLRGSQLFVSAAVAQGLASIVIGAVLVALALGRAPLWLLVAVGASVSPVTGAISALMARLRRLPYSYRRTAITLDAVRGFLGLSVYLFLTGIADLVIYSLDRAVLAIFRSPSTVGLYEGPARAHGFILQAQSAFASPTVSASARYVALGDVQRTRDLLVRGTRYTLAAAVPPTIVLTILAKPILTVWLGPEFAVAATAMSVLVGYWLVNAGVSVAGRMLITAGRARAVATYAGAVALLNLGLSLGLTPRLGLDGVVLGTTISYLLGFPFLIRLALQAFPVSLAELAREAWLPAYLTGAVVAAGLLALRLTVALDTLPKVFGAGLLAVLLYWAMYYGLWLSPSERVLVRTVLPAPVRRRSLS
jgi:O-antigen/teichoic acid export membrane protein